MASAPSNRTEEAPPRFPDDVQIDWDDVPGVRARWFGLPRWAVVANCVALCALVWWIALNLARGSSGRFPTGGAGDLALASLILVVTAAASALAVRLHSVGDAVPPGSYDSDGGAAVAVHGMVDRQTGLASRLAIERQVSDALGDDSRTSPLAVLLCEVRRLGTVRDSLGYQAGDEAMRLLAKRVADATGDRGSVGRLDGSVLAVVLDRFLTDRDVKLASEAVLETLRQPLTLSSGHVVSMAGAVGYAVAGVDDNPGQLISDAQSALSEARRASKRAIASFNPSARDAAVARIELEQDLRGALTRGELDLHYQPVIDVTRGGADRFEALVRWHHPTRGMVHPAKFLSVAAESELMVDIGSFVLRQAGRQAVQWSVAAGEPVNVSVNIDHDQLVGGNLAHDLAVILDEIGLPPGQLEIEFAEQVLERNFDEAILALQQLNVLGVKLAVDDFGTSQASLVRLQSLSMVSTLKMDRVFVEGVDSDSVDRRIVEAIVALAESIGLAVVAEGVETSAQATTLGELGVRLQQGFYHKRPGPPDDMAEFMNGSGVPLADRVGPVSG